MEVKNVQIKSHLLTYCAIKKGMEMEQHLTISNTGRVWFTRYILGDLLSCKPVSQGVCRAFIGANKAKELLDSIQSHVSDTMGCYISDVGEWEMKITYADGTTEERQSFLGNISFSDGVDVSKEIKDALPFKGVVSFG